MISRMKKVTVLCLRNHQRETLRALQQLGVLHLSHIREPGGDEWEEARTRWTDVKRACEDLVEIAGEPAGQPPVGAERPVETVLDDVWREINHYKDYRESLEFWQREALRIKPFGSFDPAGVHRLARRGFHIALYQARPGQSIVIPDDAILSIHQQDGNGTYFSVVSREPLDLPHEHVALPEAPLAQMESKMRDLQEALQASRDALRAQLPHLPALRAHADALEDRAVFLEARAGMGDAQPLAYLQGFCPEHEVDRIREGARRHGWGLSVDDVKAGDPVPTRIETPRWVNPIRPVFGFIGVVPGYEEVDISAIFLLFFSLFFAMIVGDAGYGALFLGGTWLARRKWPGLPAPAFHLLYITSTATIFWGVLTGNYFGIADLPAVLTPAVLAPVRDWFARTENMMALCFLIGAIQLTLAHGWNLIRNRRRLQALAQAGWIAIVWTMFFLAMHLVLNAEFPMIMVPVFAVGLVLLVLFMTPVDQMKTEWINHVMLPLNLVSNFVDVVSYVRLFAVGTATLAVASAFNGMAADIGASGWLGGFFAVLILLLGHTLNVLLAAMGVLVHGIRLNTLEFAGHVGLQWTGIPYRPFKRKAPDEGSGA